MTCIDLFSTSVLGTYADRARTAAIPWDRLRSASRMAQTLARIRDAIAPQGG